MYNKGQTIVLLMLINSIIDTAGIPYGNQLATIRQPKINHYTTYQDFNNKNISIIKTMYPIWNHYVYTLLNNKAGTMNATEYGYTMYTTLLNNKADTNERKRL